MPEQLSDEFWDNVIRNTLEKSVMPEVHRRQGDGRLPDDFEVYGAQVVMEAGVPAEIRLNEEVRGAISLRPGSPIPLDVEYPIAAFPEVAPYVVSFDLADGDRPNAAHITLIKGRRGWFVQFDFRYNAARIREYILSAYEFFVSARSDFEAERMRPFSASMFCAVELIAKARLIVHPDANVLRAKRHKVTISNYNRLAQQGNVAHEFAALLNRLAALRNSARYPNGTFALGTNEARAMLRTATHMLVDLMRQAPRRAVRGLDLPLPPEDLPPDVALSA
jgi:uncharacterized protein (UPF0332 family)